MKLRDPKDWKHKLGIHFSSKDGWHFLIATTFILIISYVLVDYAAGFSNYYFRPMLFHYKELISSDFPFSNILSTYIYYIPETFNEEMLIGAVLLMGMERRLKNISKTTIALLIALVFSMMHQALYKWSPVQPGTLLSTFTILTLFFVGVIRNVIILKTRKITFSWSIHLSFNLIFFAGFYVNNSTGKLPTEPEKFNIVFGNPFMLILTGALAFTAVIWLNYDYLRTIIHPVARQSSND